VTFLVDANVLSEPTKPEPAANVIEWLKSNERELAVDPIILGEIRFGIHLLPAGKRRQRLEQWFEKGVSHIVCLPWDAASGLRWAKLLEVVPRYPGRCGTAGCWRMGPGGRSAGCRG